MLWKLCSPEPLSSDALQTQRLAEEFESGSLSRNPLGAKLSRSQSTTLAQLLVARGITNAECATAFLTPSLSHLHSPYLMRGMQVAVERIEAAIDRKETILAYGDYDVDGTTAIVILKTAIELCGGTADFHVPHRILEGYDMRDDVIERAALAGIRLIISVDMGIRAFAPAETARRLGVDLIITDHHLPGPNGVPGALAVINPNQPGCDYPYKSLCGAGVAFKLAQALIARRLPHRDQARLLTSFLKITAIATVSDAVPLTGENRVITKLGLQALRSAVNPGLKALLDVAKLTGQPLTSQDVAFRIAPRINAAGRMDVARDVIDLFSAKDDTVARDIANRLDRLNSDRQEEERRILKVIHARLDEDSDLREAYCIVLEGEGWHRGVIGITATRVVERCRRPALVISRNGDEAHGSGRSIRPFHLLNALESCSALFTRFGGHSHAVGFSLPSANIAALRAHLNSYAKSVLTAADFEPTLNVDAEISLQQITPPFFHLLQRLEPFGVRNPEPIFVARDVTLAGPHRIMKEKHAKLKLAPPAARVEAKLENEAVLAEALLPRCHPDASTIPLRRDSSRPTTYNALAWNMAERIAESKILAGDALDIAFTLTYNDHADFGGIELNLKDFQSKPVTESPAPRALAVHLGMQI